MPKKGLPGSVFTVMASGFDFKREDTKVGTPLSEQNKRTQSPAPSPTSAKSSGTAHVIVNDSDILQQMKKLLRDLNALMATNPLANNVLFNDETGDPTAAPLLWIAKWIDYSDMYGFGYQLSDDSIGVNFNDTSKMILLPDSMNLQYIDGEGAAYFYIRDCAPPELQKKIKLLNHFQQYMSENLLKAGGNLQKPDYSMASLPSLWTWFRTSRAVVMVLTNGTVQINDFREHSKTILCPLIGAITTFEPKLPMKTYRFTFLEKHGCTPDLAQRIIDSIEQLQALIMSKKQPEKNKALAAAPAA